MDVTVGLSARRSVISQGPPVHLAVEVGGRQVLACTGGPVRDTRPVAFEDVLAALDCGPCRKFWNTAMKVPSGT